MGRLGYSSVTLTDLTETIPVTLVLETNQSKNVQTKIGSLYSPDFTKAGEELIITPTLFLGQEDLHIENQKDKFIIPGGREDGFIFYQVEEIDETTQLEKNYYYGSSTEESGIWVDDQGRLHYQKNLTENLTVEAYIKDFQNEEHSYIVPLVQTVNPVQFFFLDEKEGGFTLVVSSIDGRQHFEDTNDEQIKLQAILYKGATPVDTSDQTKYSFKWVRLTDKKIFDSIEDFPNQTIVKRDDVYSEEKFVCEIEDLQTKLIHSGTIDIWDLKEDYDCVIISESGLVTEITKTLPVYVNVFDSQGVLINNNLPEEDEEVTPPEPDLGGEGNDDSGIMPINEETSSTLSYKLSYDWGYFYETKDGEIERVEVLTKVSSKDFIIDFTQDIFSAIKKKSFSIFCNVYNITDNSTRRLASEVQPIQFVSEHRIDLEPQTIFISTKDNGAYGGNDDRKYSFSFKLKDRNDAVLPFVNETDLAPQGDNIEFKPVSVSGEAKYWSFTGEVDVGKNGYDIWEDDTLSSQYCEFSFTYCGFTYSAGVTIAKNLAGKSNYNIFIE